VVLDLRSLPGESIRVRGAGEEIARIQGALVPVRRYIISSGAAEAAVWLDAQGGLLRMDLPGGIALVRESKILAERL